MMNTTNEHSESWPSIETSVFDVINKAVKPHARTATRKCDIITLNIPETSGAAVPAGFQEIDDYIDAISEDEKTRQALAAARKDIANDIHGEELSIMALRLKHGWSQRDLARILGTQQPHISRLEAGTVDPQLGTINKLAEVFGVAVGDLAEAFVKRSTEAHG